jgi:hypothetical protein
MPKSAWPTGTELTNAVTGVGASIPAGYTAADIIAGIVQEWEHMTGWEPFLAEVGTQTRQYDPTFAYTLSLPGFFTITSVTVNGVSMAEGTDYWVLPYNNTSTMKPITGLRFLNPLTGLPRTISVTGRLGYDDDIHEDAWLAVLNKAVARCLEVAAGASGSISELEQGLVKVKYGQEAGRSTIDRLNSEFKKTAMRYRRAEIF